MTLDHFLARLAETPGPWYLTEHGYIRCLVNGLDTCPIHAVAKVEGESDWATLGEDLGLDGEDTYYIADCSDGFPPLVGYAELRARLLAVTVGRP